MNIILRYRFILTLMLAFPTSGCLRFFEPYTRATTSSLPQLAEIDDASFFAEEKLSEKKLERLLRERSSMVPSDAPNDYRIGSEDILELRVFDVAELNTSARVRPDGLISLPLIGDVLVKGLTEGEAQKVIVERLRSYVNRPTVGLFISQYQASKISVLGEVTKPGAYAIKRQHVSLLEVVSEAGGRTDKSSTRVLLIPNHNGSNVPIINDLIKPHFSKPLNLPVDGIEIDTDDLLGSGRGVSMSIPLIAGDTVIVREAGMVDIDGEVNRPGEYPLSSRSTILGALAAAGGLTYSANINGVEVVREISHGRKVIKSVNLEEVVQKGGRDIKLRSGDLIRVTSASGKFFTRQVVEFFNRMIRFGVSSNVPVN